MKTVIQYTATGATRVVGKLTVTTLGLRGPAGPRGLRGERGLPGAPGTGATAVPRTALDVLSGHRAVRAVDDGTVAVCDAGTLSHAATFLGVSRDAASAGAPVSVQTEGELIEPSWSWTPGLPVFVGASGALTQTSPAAGFALVVGFAQSPTSLWIQPRPPVVL